MITLDAQHVIEQTVKLYVEYDGEKWCIAPASADGYPLDAREDDPRCDYSHDIPARAECSQLLDEANEAPMPTIQQLVPLIAEHLTGEEIRDAIADLVEELLGRMR